MDNAPKVKHFKKYPRAGQVCLREYARLRAEFGDNMGKSPYNNIDMTIAMYAFGMLANAFRLQPLNTDHSPFQTSHAAEYEQWLENGTREIIDWLQATKRDVRQDPSAMYTAITEHIKKLDTFD